MVNVDLSSRAGMQKSLQWRIPLVPATCTAAFVLEHLLNRGVIGVDGHDIASVLQEAVTSEQGARCYCCQPHVESTRPPMSLVEVIPAMARAAAGGSSPGRVASPRRVSNQLAHASGLNCAE